MSTSSLSLIHPAIFIPQCWGTKQSDPENLAFASFWSTNGEDRSIRFTRSWEQKWPARHFDLPMLGIKTFWSRIFGLRVMLILDLWDQTMRSTRSWDQMWPARRFSCIGYTFAKQRYWFPNKFHWVWDQKSSSSLSFIHPVILIPQCWGTKQSDPENVASS
jgi:hypothetical protein